MLKTYYNRFIHAKYKCKYTFVLSLFSLYQLTLLNVKDILSQIYTFLIRQILTINENYIHFR